MLNYTSKPLNNLAEPTKRLRAVDRSKRLVIPRQLASRDAILHRHGMKDRAASYRQIARDDRGMTIAVPRISRSGSGREAALARDVSARTGNSKRMFHDLGVSRHTYRRPTYFLQRVHQCKLYRVSERGSPSYS